MGFLDHQSPGSGHQLLFSGAVFGVFVIDLTLGEMSSFSSDVSHLVGLGILVFLLFFYLVDLEYSNLQCYYGWVLLWALA